LHRGSVVACGYAAQQPIPAALRATREKWSRNMPARSRDYGLSQRGSRNPGDEGP